MSNFSLGRKIVSYISNADNLEYLQECYENEILPLYPDDGFRTEVIEILDHFGNLLLAPVLTETSIPDHRLESVRPHLRLLSTIYLCNQVNRAYDLAIGLTVRKNVCIEDYTKIRRMKDESPHLHFKNRVCKPKSNDRSRGPQLSRYLENYKPSKKERYFVDSVPLDLDRTTLLYEVFYHIFRVVRDLIQNLDIYENHHIDLAACYWTNKFVLHSRYPIPSRQPDLFYQEWKAVELEEFLKNDGQYKFNLTFWRSSFNNRKHKLLVVKNDRLCASPALGTNKSVSFVLNFETSAKLIWMFNQVKLCPASLRPLIKVLDTYLSDQ